MGESHGILLFVTQAEATTSQRDSGPIIPEMFGGHSSFRKLKNKFLKLYHTIKKNSMSRVMLKLFEYHCCMVEQLD
jgi:hypothetical protein